MPNTDPVASDGVTARSDLQWATAHTLRMRHAKGLKGAAYRAAGYVRARMWEQLMRPDVDVIHRRAGMFGVTAFLQNCTDPDFTKEVLSRFGAKIHADSWAIGPNVTMHDCPEGYANLSIGAYAHIGKQVFFDMADRIVIEDSVAVGMRTIILTHVNVGHGWPNKPVTRAFPEKKKPTILRRGCSVGAACLITCGIEIGEDAVIGPGVTLVKDVPPRTYVTTNRQKADYRMPDQLFEMYVRDQLRAAQR